MGSEEFLSNAYEILLPKMYLLSNGLRISKKKEGNFQYHVSVERLSQQQNHASAPSNDL